MEGDEPKSQSLSEPNEYLEHVAENVVVFQQYVDEVLEAVEQDENFSEMTAESYDKKKSYIKSHLGELTSIHNSLADQYADLIEEASKNCPSLLQNQHHESSDSSSSPQDTHTIAPKFTTATGFDVLWHPDGGGFYLSKGKGSTHASSGSSMSSANKTGGPPPNNDALKVEESKDSCSESSMSSVNKPAVPPVNDDALKIEETNEALHKKISNLEQEVASLKQKLQSLTVENDELKQEVEDNVKDIRVYMSESKLETRSMEEELQASKEFARTIDEHMCRLLAEKLSNQSKHDAEMIEMNKKMNQYMEEITQLTSTHEKKEKIWNGVTEQLRNDLKGKCEMVEELSKNMEDLMIDRSFLNSLIHQLRTELNSVKYENVWVRPSFDNIQKLTDEVKLKAVELEREVSRQREAMLDRDRK